MTGAVTGATLDLNTLVQYGALGVIVVLFVAGKIVPSKTLEERERRLAQLEDENARLRKAFEEQVIPALIRSTDQLERLSRRRAQ